MRKIDFFSAIAAATVDVDGPLVEQGACSVIVASSYEQGLVNFRHLLSFLQPSFELYGVGATGRYRISDSANRASILDKKTGAMIRVLGSDPRRLHGLAPKILLLDEVSQWPPAQLPSMLAALRTSRGKIPGSRCLWIGTRPSDDEHPFARALDGHGTGYQLVYAAPKDADPFLKSTWRRANPSLDHLPDLLATIRNEAKDAKLDPAMLSTFRALRLNQGVSDSLSFGLIDSDTWRVALGLPPPGERSKDYVLAVDPGQNDSMSAASAYFRTGELDSCAVFPENPSLAERGLGDGVGRLYVDMAARGELVQAGSRVSDLGELLRMVLRRWGRPVSIACDRWRMAELKQHLEAVGFPVASLVERGQGFKDGGQDVRDFRSAVLSGEVRPASNLLLTAAMAEARTTGDPAGNWKLAKRTQAGRRAMAKDDAAAAAIMAVGVGRRRWSRVERRPMQWAVV